MPDFHLAPFFIVFESTGDVVDSRDFSRYDGYLGDLGVLYLQRDNGKVTVTLDPKPPRQDTGQSSFEQRPEFGDFFAQGDFSHGAGQRFFNRPDRDEKKFLYSEGFDITEPGVLTHLNQTAISGSFSSPTAMAEVDMAVFVADGSSVFMSDGDLADDTFVEENPEGTEDPRDVLSLAASGAELFAALGEGGIHRRASDGTWAHMKPDGGVDVEIGDVTLVRWLKDRLIATGNAGRELYEVVADSTPPALETLPEGWVYTDAWEAGAFILATAVNEDAGLSRIHAYGLNDDASAIVKKTSTPMPKGDLAYSGCEVGGRVFVGGGRQNAEGGKNAILYEAGVASTGEAQLLLRQVDKSDVDEDLSVRCFEVLGDRIVFGWSSSSFDNRTGLASFHLGRNAFSYHLKGQSTLDQVRDVMTYRGQLAFLLEDLLYEDIGNPVDVATLVTSMADWNTSSMKTWDVFELTHDSLVVNTSVQVEYTKSDPVLEQWEPALLSSTPGALGAAERLQDLRARRLALKLTSRAPAIDAPVIQSYSVRSVPSPDQEWNIIRTVRVVDRDRKDSRAERVNQDPAVVRGQILDLSQRFVVLYEVGVAWIAYVQSVAEVELPGAEVSETSSPAERQAFYFELRMVGEASVMVMSPQDPWKIEVGPREIYDAVMGTRRDVEELRKDYANDKDERDALKADVATAKQQVQNMRGTLKYGAGAIAVIVFLTPFVISFFLGR